VERTIVATGERELYLRIVVTRGAGELGLDPALADAPRLIVIALPVKLPPPEAYRDGVDVAIVTRSRTAPGTVSVDPTVKSGNYLVSVLAVADARKHGAFEAILCDQVGRITEGSSSKFFIVRGGRVVTPPLSAGLLEGITRRHVIAVLRGAGLPVDETPLWPVDLQRADEAFLTSSVRGVVPISRVGGQGIGGGVPGPITRRAMALYDALTHGETERGRGARG
jgi:branched-chain amino acid aminotransferase